MPVLLLCMWFCSLAPKFVQELRYLSLSRDAGAAAVIHPCSAVSAICEERKGLEGGTGLRISLDLPARSKCKKRLAVVLTSYVARVENVGVRRDGRYTYARQPSLRSPKRIFAVVSTRTTAAPTH